MTDQIGLPGREVQFEVFADFNEELDKDEPEEVETVLTETAQSLKIYAERMGQKLDSGNGFWQTVENILWIFRLCEDLTTLGR